jgi:hypothetical protein
MIRKNYQFFLYLPSWPSGVLLRAPLIVVSDVFSNASLYLSDEEASQLSYSGQD